MLSVLGGSGVSGLGEGCHLKKKKGGSGRTLGWNLLSKNLKGVGSAHQGDEHFPSNSEPGDSSGKDGIQTFLFAYIWMAFPFPPPPFKVREVMLYRHQDKEIYWAVAWDLVTLFHLGLELSRDSLALL